MYVFNIEIAKIVVKISCEYNYLYEQCKDFFTDKKEYFTVSASKSDIGFEAELSMKVNGTVLDECYLESSAIYRKICKEIINYDAFLMHSAVVKIDGAAVAFIGKSGAGKTTQSSFWVSNLGAEYINGDKPIYRLIDGKFLAFGTPWNGKEKLGSNTFAPLKAIVKVNKAQENRIEKISAYDAVPLCITQIYFANNNPSINKILDLLEGLLDNTNVYLLNCKKELESAKITYNEIKSGF